MTYKETPELSDSFSHKLTEILADFFQEESVPEEVMSAVEVDIKININLSKLSELYGEEALLVVGEKRITLSSKSQPMLVLSTTCKRCPNPDPNDICSYLGKYCQR